MAEHDGRLVGYARLEYLWSIVPYLALIYVVEGYRRKGVGRQILYSIESFLVAFAIPGAGIERFW